VALSWFDLRPLTMLGNSRSSALPSDLSALLSSRLRLFRTEEAVLAVAKKVLQKSPGKLKALIDEVEVASGGGGRFSAAQRAWIARRALARSVEDVVAHGEGGGRRSGGDQVDHLPHHLENYLSYLELLSVSMGAADDAGQTLEGKVASKTWWTFTLNDHDVSSYTYIKWSLFLKHNCAILLTGRHLNQ